MKGLRQFVVGLGVIGAMTLCPTAARADLEVTASVTIRATTEFHAPLAPYGSWIEVGSYGRCWRPARVAVGWRPYCEGNWVWTDCGWYWQSDEPWAWACYHYGNWYEAPDYGWVWVPGIDWAPAWVDWRFGGGYCGWSPAPPHGVAVRPAAFVFVETHRFHEPVHRSRVIVNNTTIINQTTIIGGASREERNISGQRAQRVIVNKGPDVAQVSRGSNQRQAAPTPIREVARRSDPPEKLVRELKQAQSKQSGRAPANAREEGRRPVRDGGGTPRTPDRTPDATASPKPTTETAPSPTPANPERPRRNVPDSSPEAVNPAPVQPPNTAPSPNRPQRAPGPPEQRPGQGRQNRPVTPAPPTPPPGERAPQPGKGRSEDVTPAPTPAPVQPNQSQREQQPPPRGKAKGQDKEKKE